MYEAEYLAAVVHIKLLGRLIKQIYLGILQAELGQPHRLLLAAGKLRKVTSGQMGHAYASQRGIGQGIISRGVSA